MVFPKLVIFDCDGVITDTAILHYESWNKTTQMWFKRNLDLSCIDKFRGLSREKSVKLILNYLQINTLSEKDAKKFTEDKNKIYLALIKTPGKVKLFKSTFNLIKILKNNSIKIALGSISRNAVEILKITNIYNYFDYLVNLNDIHKLKPDPEIFLNAMNYFNYNSWECWGIEDAKVGVQSITAAQQFCIGIGDRKLLYKANIIFENIDKLSFEKSLKKYQKFLKNVNFRH